MKKSLSFILVFLFLLISVSALETNLKSSYNPRETLILELQGNFIDNLRTEDISFYSGRLFVPMIYDLARIENKYYIYALLPEKERNYSLLIKNAHYFELGSEKLEDLQFNFSVKGNFSFFSINPGFIITSKDFSIKVLAFKAVNLKAEFLNSTQEISIPEGQEKKISFSISGLKESETTFLALEAGETKYKIPVAVFKEKLPETQEKALRFSKSYLNLTVLKSKEFQFEISLLNIGQEDIENISLETDLNIQLEPEKIEKLIAGDMKKINLTLTSGEPGLKQGKITATSENYSSELQVYINTIEDEQEFIEISNKSEITESSSCSELNGKTCDYTEGEKCEGTSKTTIDGICCIGDCKKPSSLGKYISFIVILIVLAIIGFFVYRKLKLKRLSSKEFLKSKEKDYEERFQARESRGNLTRV